MTIYPPRPCVVCRIIWTPRTREQAQRNKSCGSPACSKLVQRKEYRCEPEILPPSPPDHPTLTGRLMGDPKPGRSALDKIRQGQGS